MRRAVRVSVGAILATLTAMAAAAALSAQPADVGEDRVSLLIRNDSDQTVRVRAARAGTEAALDVVVDPQSVRLTSVSHDAFGSGKVSFEFGVGPAARPVSLYRTPGSVTLSPGDVLVVDIPARVANLSIARSKRGGKSSTGGGDAAARSVTRAEAPLRSPSTVEPPWIRSFP